MVVVFGVGETGSQTSVIKRLLGREPRLPFETVGDNRPVVAVEIIVEVRVGFQLPKEWKQFLEVPLVVALGGPRVIVLGDATQEDLAVDGAGASGNLASGNQHGRGGFGALADELPVMVTYHNVDFRGISELYFLGQVLELGIVRSRLQDQHGPLWVLG